MNFAKLLVCSTALLFAPVAFSQQITGSIRGTITAPSGAVVEAANVSAKQSETGLTRATTTDRSGTYLLLELPVGHYQVQIEHAGFQTYLQQGITLDVNETATVSVSLKVGTGAEKIE